MQGRVILIKSEEGYAVAFPALPGCWTQGATEEEAVENIREAAALWLEAGGEALDEAAELAAYLAVLHEAKTAGLRTQTREVDLPVAA